MPTRDQRAVLPATAHLPPQAHRVGHSAAAPPAAPSQQAQQQAAADALSVILVTGSYDGTIRYWEAWSGICSRTIQTQDHQPNRLAISPDKRFLAAAGVNTVKLYDVAQSAAASSTNVAPLVTLQGHTANVTSLAWQNEAKWLVSGSEDGTVKIWDVRTSSPQRNYAHLASVNDLALHSNQGELISCDQNGAIKVWDLGGDRCSHELLPEEDVPMRSVSIASDGSALVGGNHKGVVYVWTIQPGLAFTDLQPKTRFQAHSRYLIRVLISPDTKQLATCSADTTIKIWTPILPSPSSSSPNPSSPSPAAAAADPGGGGTTYARGGGGIADGTGYQLDKVLQGHQRWVWDMAYSADSAYLVSASSDHTARLWELSSGTTVRQYSAHHKACVCVALNDSSA
ncbi:WD40 repeat-like protein [Rhodotorula sp. JG-1b]|nr:WD40 repeat-like protein [Rhodotorula sp. JG-1b]